MTIRKILTQSAVCVVACACLLSVTPAMAYGWHRHYYHNGGGNFAAGMFFGAAFGFLAGAAANSGHYYYRRGCARRVFVRHVCRVNRWGYEHCYQVRRVRWYC